MDPPFLPKWAKKRIKIYSRVLLAQTDKQIDRQTDRQTDRQRDGQTNGQRDIHLEGRTD